MRALTMIAVALLAVSAAALVARYVPIRNRVLLAVAALAPYLMLGAPLAVVSFGFARHWVSATMATVLTVATVAVQMPWHFRTKAPPGVGVRLVSANLRYGRADPAAVVQIVRATNADILGVQELTPEKAELLSARGLDELLPHRALRAREGPAGVGIWSRYPVDAGTVDERFWLGLLTARIHIPGVHAPSTVVVTHMSAPWPEPIDGWRTDLNRLGTALQEVATDAEGPIMVAADLNATRDIREFRRLLRDGYRDGAEQAGAGLTRTHPADIFLPPVFAVDHILTRGCVATSMRTLRLPGSDHRALVAEVIAPDATPLR
jgi:endonuclease/exonuclease/phosphatase (EEP) superfamily protein YafD